MLCRIQEAAGATVQRTSFGGDVGLHVAKCLWGMRSLLGGEFPDKLAEVADDAFGRATWVSACYVEGATHYEKDAEIKAEIDELREKLLFTNLD